MLKWAEILRQKQGVQGLEIAPPSRISSLDQSTSYGRTFSQLREGFNIAIVERYTYALHGRSKKEKAVHVQTQKITMKGKNQGGNETLPFVAKSIPRKGPQGA